MIHQMPGACLLGSKRKILSSGHFQWCQLRGTGGWVWGLGGLRYGTRVGYSAWAAFGGSSRQRLVPCSCATCVRDRSLSPIRQIEFLLSLCPLSPAAASLRHRSPLPLVSPRNTITRWRETHATRAIFSGNSKNKDPEPELSNGHFNSSGFRRCAKCCMGAPRGNDFLFAPLGAGGVCCEGLTRFEPYESWWHCVWAAQRERVSRSNRHGKAAGAAGAAKERAPAGAAVGAAAAGGGSSSNNKSAAAAGAVAGAAAHRPPTQTTVLCLGRRRHPGLPAPPSRTQTSPQPRVHLKGSRFTPAVSRQPFHDSRSVDAGHDTRSRNPQQLIHARCHGARWLPHTKGSCGQGQRGPRALAAPL